MADKKLSAGTFVGVCIAVIISLVGIVRSGDTKAIEQNTKKLDIIDSRVDKNCQEISALKESNEYLKKAIDDANKKLDTINRHLINISRAVKSP